MVPLLLVGLLKLLKPFGGSWRLSWRLPRPLAEPWFGGALVWASVGPLAPPRPLAGQKPCQAKSLAGPRALPEGPSGPRPCRQARVCRAKGLAGPRALPGQGPCRAKGLAGPRALPGQGPCRAKGAGKGLAGPRALPGQGPCRAKGLGKGPPRRGLAGPRAPGPKSLHGQGLAGKALARQGPPPGTHGPPPMARQGPVLGSGQGSWWGLSWREARVRGLWGPPWPGKPCSGDPAALGPWWGFLGALGPGLGWAPWLRGSYEAHDPGGPWPGTGGAPGPAGLGLGDWPKASLNPLPASWSRNPATRDQGAPGGEGPDKP